MSHKLPPKKAEFSDPANNVWRTGPAKRVPLRSEAWVMEPDDTKYVRQRVYPVTVLAYDWLSNDYIVTPDGRRKLLRPGERIFASRADAQREQAALEQVLLAVSELKSAETTHSDGVTARIVRYAKI